MSNGKANHVERLLVYPGHDCACCIGRFGFANGLRELIESHPVRTRKEILKLNPLYVRQLPSFQHQMVHVETMMAGMKMDLPRLFKKWSRHLQSYPELPYLLHFSLASRDGETLRGDEILRACRKASPFKIRQPELVARQGFSLKRRWSRPEVVQEVLRNFAGLFRSRGEFRLDEPSYLAQLTVLYSDQLKALRVQRNRLNGPVPAIEDAPYEAREQRRNAMQFMPAIIDHAYRDLAESILPAMIRTAQVDQIHSFLSKFFVAGGSYRESRLNIASLVLDIEPELLLLLNRYRDKLNDVSIEVLDTHLDEVNRNLPARRAAARAERLEADRLREQAGQARHARQARQARQAAEAIERRRVAAARAAHRAAGLADRTESLPNMTRRLSVLDPLARMKAVAGQIDFAPASFPSDWARDLTVAHIAQLDAAARETLIERTRGVQRGEWKVLRQRIVEFLTPN